MAATSRPKTQCVDNKFGQDNDQGREPVKILGKNYNECIILSISVQAWRRQEVRQPNNSESGESEPSVEKLEDGFINLVYAKITPFARGDLVVHYACVFRAPNRLCYQSKRLRSVFKQMWVLLHALSIQKRNI